jgi:hypothetical protein
MIFPFIGLFISLTLWGALFPVPRVSDPSESFVDRLTGAMRVTILVKGAFDLVEMFSTHGTLPRHEDPVPCFQEVAPWVDFAELADLPNGKTETGLSEGIPLWVETIEEEPVVGNGSDMSPSWGHVVDIESTGPESVVSTSPAPSRVVILVVGLAALAVLCSLLRAFVPADAYKLEDALEKLNSFLEPSPKAACLVADCGPSVYDEVVALVDESGCHDYFNSLPGGSESDSDLPLEEEVAVVYIHCEVEMDNTRLEQQRVTGVPPEVEPCIIEGRTIPGWTAMSGGLVEPSTTPVPAGSDVSDQLDTDTEDSATRPGHKELSPPSTMTISVDDNNDDDDDGDDEISQLLREIGRERRAYQELLEETRTSRRRMRERLASLWPGALDE